MSFRPARARLVIGSLDDSNLTITAQYNPTELELSKDVPYGETPGIGVTPSSESQRTATANNGAAKLEFTGAKGRSIKIDLFFDGFEDHKSIEPMIDILDKLSSARDATSLDENLRRPHHCIVTWGKSGRTIPPFRCAITSLSVKYTMFSADGLPLRAMATLTLSESGVVELQAANDRSFDPGRSLDAMRALAALNPSAPIAAIAARISSGVRFDVSARAVAVARRVLG